MYLGKNRKLNRWLGYDYNTPGWYFVTICTQNKVAHFGIVKNGVMELNSYGQIALKYLKQIPNIYKGVELDEFQIMPNHIHGIIFINECQSIGAHNVGTEYYSVPTQSDVSAHIAPIDDFNHYGKLSKIIKSFKHATTKKIRNEFNDYNFSWQRSFHDHVIRGEKDYNAIKYYIQQNPMRWDEDRNNPINFNK